MTGQGDGGGTANLGDLKKIQDDLQEEQTKRIETEEKLQQTHRHLNDDKQKLDTLQKFILLSSKVTQDPSLRGKMPSLEENMPVVCVFSDYRVQYELPNPSFS